VNKDCNDKKKKIKEKWKDVWGSFQDIYPIEPLLSIPRQVVWYQVNLTNVWFIGGTLSHRSQELLLLSSECGMNNTAVFLGKVSLLISGLFESTT